MALGDQLFLEIEGSQKMYVYVFDEDQSGNAVLLFPLEGLDLENPLAAGSRHRLPGKGDEVMKYWDVTSSGGSDVILVIASAKRLEEIEGMLDQMAQAGDVESMRLSAELEQVRGVAGLSPKSMEAPGGGETNPLAGVREGLGVRAGNSDDVWVWEMRLSNPAP